jgi:translation initiation factor IF-2
MRRKSGEVIKALLDLGVMATVNELLDPTAAKLVADKFNVDVEIRSVEGDVVDEEDVDPAQPRCARRSSRSWDTSTTARRRCWTPFGSESGREGVRRHHSAHRCLSGHDLTRQGHVPRHAGSRGVHGDASARAQATDIVILVVAADDGVMPQTQEAINHARAANVPIIVAVNKIDRPEADPDRVKRELSNLNLVPEEWGGQTIFVPTSAKMGTGIEQLLEMTALQSEILELKANSSRAAKGVIIEGRLDRGRGPVATALIQNGTLKEGDAVVVGSTPGGFARCSTPPARRSRAQGRRIPSRSRASESRPRATCWWPSPTSARRQIATMRLDREKAKGKASTRITLEGLQKQIQTGEVKELRLILKADVQGSVEALGESLERLRPKRSS